MSGSLRMKAVLLRNPTAGDQFLSAERLISVIEDAGYSVTCQSTKELDLDAIPYRDTDLIVIAGGDGTIAKVVTRLPDRSTPLSIFPTGTANNIARSLGIQGTPEEIAAGWGSARRGELGIGVTRGPAGDCRFVEGVGFGAFAHSLAYASEDDGGRARKMERGRDAFRRALAEDQPLRLDMRVDGEALPGELLFVEILNIGYVGPGLHLAPAADPGDGVLDVVYIGPDRRGAMIDWLDSGCRNPAPVKRRRGRQVKIGVGGGLMRVDDECMRLADGAGQVSVALDTERVTILVPAANGELDNEPS